MHPWECFQTDFEESETSNTCWAELGFLINGNTTHRIKEELEVNNWCVELYYMVRMQMVSVPPHGLKIQTADPHLWLSLRSSILPYLLMQLNALLYYMGKLWKPFQKINIHVNVLCTILLNYCVIIQSLFYKDMTFTSDLRHANNKSQ